MQNDWRTRLQKAARETLGFDDVHPEQERPIEAVLRGRDTLVVMPTGSGKSAIYQLAGMLLHGLTIIVSPLIALQRDQVVALEDAGLSAAHLNSTLSNGEHGDLFARLDAGMVSFVFLAPEQLANEKTVNRLKRANPALFVVDEAHCITDWGHDFRPDYLQLGPVIEQLAHPPVLALTATAAGPVRDEIIARLGMRDPAVFVQGFDRPNISLGVETFRDPDDKRATMIERAGNHAGSGIIYAATRQATEEIAAALSETGRSAAAYHAGLKTSERDDIQSRFMANELKIMVATIAFGMGIDKPDIRFVFHHDISESLDAYYQEIGRAGRDGEPADAVLFYHPDNLDLRRFQSGAGELKAEDVRPVLATIQRANEAVDPADLREALNARDSQINRALHRLEEVGAVTIEPSGEVVATETEQSIEEAATAAAEAQNNLRQYATTRLEMMRQYAETADCRREFLLNYFGEPYEGPCGSCDTCLAGTAETTAHGAEPFALQSVVIHTTWGEGTVMHYEDGKIVILFPDAGYRTLDLDLVREGHLLRPKH
jgi:ATP-dependent DNA helicase RecQ